MAAGLFVSLLGGSFLKNVVMRRRPDFDNSEIQCLRAPSGRGDVMEVAAQGYSFPSLHATETVVMFGYFLDRCHNWLWIFIGCATLFIHGWFLCRTNDFFSIYGLMCGSLLAFHFEQRKVNFSNIPNSLRSVVRTICALTLFLAISKGLKLPFSKEFLASDGFAAHFVCAARCAIASFVTIGVYPMVFKHTDRFFRRDV